MTLKQQIDEILELAAGGTPGDWETNYTGNIWGDIDNPEHDGDSPLLGNILEQKNARFIAKAPQMVSIIRQQQKHIEELEAHLEWNSRIVKMHLENYTRLQEGINKLNKDKEKKQ